MAKDPLVLIVSNDEDAFWRHRLWFAKELARRGFDAQGVGPAPNARRPETGIPYHSIPFDRKSLNPFVEWRTRRHLVRLYKRLRPDIAHHFTLKAIVHGTAAAGDAVATVNTITGLGWAFTTRTPQAWVARRLILKGLRRAARLSKAAFVFQNPSDKLQLHALRVVRMEQAFIIAGSGVDVDRWSLAPAGEGPVRFVLPARILWDKGVREFVEAARIVRSRGIRADFDLVGAVDAANRAAIPANELRELLDGGPVRYLGESSDLRDQFREAHVVCLPSYREGLPRVLLEAAAAGRAVLTTNVPGCRDAVVPGETGLLVPPRDAPALADAMIRLATDSSLRRRLGIGGERLARSTFDRQKIVDAYVAIYQTLLGRD